MRGKKSCSVGQLLLGLDVSETMTALARRGRDERAAVKPNVTRQVLRAAALSQPLPSVQGGASSATTRLRRAVGNRQTAEKCYLVNVKVSFMPSWLISFIWRAPYVYSGSRLPVNIRLILNWLAGREKYEACWHGISDD